MAWVMVGTAAVSLGVGIWQSAKANNKAKKELKKANELEQDIKDFEASRQPVINRADEIRAMKNKLTNPNANLPVATYAAISSAIALPSIFSLSACNLASPCAASLAFVASCC